MRFPDLGSGIPKYLCWISRRGVRAGGLQYVFQFGYVGEEQVNLEFTSTDGTKQKKSTNFIVNPGNMVQFTGFKINTYHDMECNPISKIEFIFLKLFSGNFNNEKLSSNEWFRSDMESKPEAWEWDLSEEKLFIAP